MKTEDNSKLVVALTEILGAPVKFNSCNGWGFGGGVGLCWEGRGVKVKVFTAYYRHMKPERVVTLREERPSGWGPMVLDEIRTSKSEEQLLEAVRQRVA